MVWPSGESVGEFSAPERFVSRRKVAPEPAAGAAARPAAQKEIRRRGADENAGPEQQSGRQAQTPPRGSHDGLSGSARKRLDVEREVVRRVEPLLGVFLQAVADDPLEAGGDRLVRDGEIRRIFLEDRGHRLARRVGVERALAREHLVEDGAEREDVRARVGGLALDLLGRHVADRAHDHAGLGARGRRQVGLRSRALVDLRELGEAEVEDLDAAFVRDEEVLGLQVPVDDPLVVRGGEAVGDLQGVVDHPALRKLPRGEGRAQRLALEQLLDDVRRVVVRADVVDGGDVGVVEDAGGLRLLLESAQPVRVLREGRRQHLDRDLAPEARILRAVDLAHPPGADLAEDFVGAELRAARERHRSPVAM